LYKAHEQRTGSFDFAQRGCTLCASALVVKDVVKNAIAAVTSASLAAVTSIGWSLTAIQLKVVFSEKYRMACDAASGPWRVRYFT
jgi:hypothetical protein